MPDREKQIDKIKALLAKTTANGATEHEMLAALDKASALMDAYDITDADVQEARDEAMELHAEPPDTTDPHSIKWRLSWTVGEFCGVQIYRKAHQAGLKCIGMPSDVQFAMWLLDTLADHVFEALYGHLIGCCAPNAERRVVIRSFVEAACDHISDRLMQLVARSQMARTSNGRELVLVKNAAIKEFMKEAGIRLTYSGGHAPSTSNAAAAAAGRAAGAKASFGRPVSGAGATLRIGK